MNRKELLVSWLNAYAMEKALIPILENHADDVKGHPEMERRIRGHAQKLRSCGWIRSIEASLCWLCRIARVNRSPDFFLVRDRSFPPLQTKRCNAL